MNILNSVFGADRDTSNKTKEKAKRGKKQVKAAGKHSNCLYVSYIISINQSEPKADNFDFPYSQVIGRKSQL